MTQTVTSLPTDRPPQSLVRARIHEPWLWRQQRRAAENRRASQAVPLSNHVRLLVRYRWWLAVFAVLGLAVGLVAANSQKPLWVSGATILTPAIAMDSQTPLDKPVRKRKAITIDTEAVTLTSYQVLQRAVAGTNVTPRDLFHATSVTAAPNSRVIKVQITDPNPERARYLVTNLADAYLDYRRQLLTDRRSQQVAAVQREINALQSEIKGLPAATPADLKNFSADPVNAKLGQLRSTLSDLQSTEIEAGDLLRSATDPRKVARQPEVRVLSWLLVLLIVGGILIAWRERRPPAPRSADAINRVPMAIDLPVAVYDEDGPVDDGHGGWVQIADAIGPIPAATLIVRLDDGPAEPAVEALSLTLRRAGHTVRSMTGRDQESPVAGSATAIMLQVRAEGWHLVGEGPALADLDHSLSTTQADAVVVLFAPGAVSQRELDAAIEHVVRHGVPVLGVILDRANERHSRLDRLTSKFTG